MKKIVLLLVVGVTIVSGIIVLNMGEKVVKDSNPIMTPFNEEVSTSVTSSAGVQDEISLDAVFGQEEPADNFDDIIE